MRTRAWTPADLQKQPISWIDCNTCRCDYDGVDIVGIYDKEGHSYRPLSGYIYSIGENKINSLRWLGGVSPSDTNKRMSLGCLTAGGWLKEKSGVTICGVWWHFPLETTAQSYVAINNCDENGVANTTQAGEMLRIVPSSTTNGNVLYNWRRVSTDTRGSTTLTTGQGTDSYGLIFSSALDAENAEALIHGNKNLANWGGYTAQNGITKGKLKGCTRTTYEIMLGFERANMSGALNIALGEFLLFDEALNPDEIAKIEGYLAHKWGVLNALNTAHPYFSNAPYVTIQDATPIKTFDETKYILHVCEEGERIDTIAANYYYNENMMDLILAVPENRPYVGKYIFEGGETLLIPIISQEEAQEANSAPPWRT